MRACSALLVALLGCAVEDPTDPTTDPVPEPDWTVEVEGPLGGEGDAQEPHDGAPACAYLKVLQCGPAVYELCVPADGCSTPVLCGGVGVRFCDGEGP